MLRTKCNAVEANNLSKSTPPRKAKAKPKGLPTIKCECGQEILLIPDVKEMGQAIENHAEKHARKLKKDPAKAEAEATRIRDDLTAKVLEKASQLKLKNSSHNEKRKRY